MKTNCHDSRGLDIYQALCFFLRKGVRVEMNMTGFERLLRTLRGLATAYGIYVIIDNNGVFLYYSEDIRHNVKVPNEAIENEIAFEEFIKDFVREVKNDRSINTECSDLP